MTTVLACGQVFDGRGESDGDYREILIDGDRIVDIGVRGSARRHACHRPHEPYGHALGSSTVMFT